MTTKPETLVGRQHEGIESALDRIRNCAEGMAQVFGPQANALIREKRHLQEGTSERAYWHHGLYGRVNKCPSAP